MSVVMTVCPRKTKTAKERHLFLIIPDNARKPYVNE